MIYPHKIYGLKLKDDDKIRYIGLTKQSLSRRMAGHFSHAKRKKYKVSNWLNKYKDNVEIILIEDNIPNREECCKKEREYIKLFKSFGANLLNHTDGGEIGCYNKGHNKSQEWKDMMSKRMIGNKITLGRKMTPTHKEKHKKFIETRKIKTKVIYNDSEYYFNGLQEFADFFSISLSGAHKWIKNGKKNIIIEKV